jgi:competence protein ComEC
VTHETAEASALRPLWLLTTGAVAGALFSTANAARPPTWLPLLLLIFGIAAAATAFRWKRHARLELLLLAGLALVSGRGLAQTGPSLDLARVITDGETVIRTRVVITEGWMDSRWGLRTRVRIAASHLREERVKLPRSCRLEVRGNTTRAELPPPGSEIDVVARVRGQARNPLLVIASGRLVTSTGARRLLPTIRNHLAESLLAAAGTNVKRIRAAEMAAALALGRRDLLPVERRDRWRRSGLAHLLAVSGLHVGLVGGAVWLALALAGAGPRATRVTVLVAVPAYAVLAGAAPSAMRAALMAVIYFGARLLGRAILPMAAVLLAVTILLVADPSLVFNVGFQLTVVITAALVRWVPALTDHLFGPRWLTGAVAVPVVAQAAAAPIVASHFRTLIPGAIIANLFALPLLAPTILGSVASAAIAPLWRAPATFGLEAVACLLSLLQLVSSPARAVEIITPPVPATAAALLLVAGWSALQRDRWARVGLISWFGLLMAVTVSWGLLRPPRDASIELLPVSDGAAVMVADDDDAVLVDAGRYRRESSLLLSETGRRRLRAVIASHTDEDHIGGIDQILRSLEVERFILPVWMMAQPQVVPLLRSARRSNVLVQPVASGSALSLGSVDFAILWPPARQPPRSENERSLVARVRIDGGSALCTADIGATTESRLARSFPLQIGVLIVPHHGGRRSTSAAFLAAVSPSVALIPAALGNTHGHPHAEVLHRLEDRGIPSRYPARDGWCGARWNGSQWVPFP